MLEQPLPISELRETRASVRLCIIITLVKQAELYHDMQQSSLPSASERAQYRSSCMGRLSEVVTVTAEFSPGDYYYLDPYVGVGASVSYCISGFIYLGLGDKVCWSRAISLLAEELSDVSKSSSDLDGTLSRRSPSLTAGTLEAQLSVLRLARRSVGMSVCLVPGGPKSLCSQLGEYRRASSLNNLGRFTEV